MSPPSHLPPHPTPRGCRGALGLIWIWTNHFICLGPFSPILVALLQSMLSSKWPIENTNFGDSEMCHCEKSPLLEVPFRKLCKKEDPSLKHTDTKWKHPNFFNPVYVGQHFHSLLLKKYQNLWAMFIYPFSHQGAQFWRETFKKPQKVFLSKETQHLRPPQLCVTFSFCDWQQDGPSWVAHLQSVYSYF